MPGLGARQSVCLSTTQQWRQRLCATEQVGRGCHHSSILGHSWEQASTATASRSFHARTAHTVSFLNTQHRLAHSQLLRLLTRSRTVDCEVNIGHLTQTSYCVRAFLEIMRLRWCFIKLLLSLCSKLTPAEAVSPWVKVGLFWPLQDEKSSAYRCIRN